MNPSPFSHLLSPLKIGSIKVRNRVLVSAHVPGLAVQNKPSRAYINYHEAYAKAGVGLQITGGTPIHRSGMLSLGSDGLWNLDDSIIPGYRALAAAVHQHGGRILAQLAHSAGTVLIQQPNMCNWSASATRSQTTGGIAHAMSQTQIKEVLQAYTDGARRAIEGQLDGIEILAAFGFLPQAFLSPLTNHRTDKYGGSFNNRIRFVIELVEKIRNEIGTTPILGIRIPGDEYEKGGLHLQQMQQIASQLCATGLLDYISVTAHTNLSHSGRAKHWAPTPAPHGMFVELASGIKQVVDIPVFTVGRIVDPAHADNLLANKSADMIGMTRAHISDPEIVSKLKRNAAGEIRPCVGTNNCIANRYLGKPIRCIHNPLVGKSVSATLPQRTKKIIIVGAGPAGLEAARVSAEYGYNVEIHEKNAYAGGQLALWARSPGQRELHGIIKWRLDELKRLGISIAFHSSLSEHDIDNSNANVAIIATGAIAHLEHMPGDQSIMTKTPHEILEAQQTVRENVIVYNDGKGQAGLAAAEWLAHHGAQVHIITSDIAVAADLDATNRYSWYERLGSLRCQLTGNSVIEDIRDKRITIKNLFSDQQTVIDDIGLIVDWRGSRSNPLTVKKIKTIKIGDCLTPRNVEIAISEAATSISELT